MRLNLLLGLQAYTFGAVPRIDRLAARSAIPLLLPRHLTERYMQNVSRGTNHTRPHETKLKTIDFF